MRNLALYLGALVLAAWLVPAPAGADCLNCTNIQVFAQPMYPAPVYPPPVAYAPSPYVAYAPSPYFYPPPAFYLGSDYDPDYRDIRYNRYFQRYEPRPQIRGYTLR